MLRKDPPSLAPLQELTGLPSDSVILTTLGSGHIWNPAAFSFLWMIFFSVHLNIVRIDLRYSIWEFSPIFLFLLVVWIKPGVLFVLFAEWLLSPWSVAKPSFPSFLRLDNCYSVHTRQSAYTFLHAYLGYLTILAFVGSTVIVVDVQISFESFFWAVLDWYPWVQLLDPIVIHSLNIWALHCDLSQQQYHSILLSAVHHVMHFFASL